MKKFTMTDDAVQNLVARSKVGRISTIGDDGYPYTVAVHFVECGGKIYFHGLNKGEKISNIQSCPKVCFELDEYTALIEDNIASPCEADAEYESVVIRGNAIIVEDFAKKKQVLTKIIEKYAPAHLNLPMTDARINGTAVIEITPVTTTGKYHK